MLNTQSTELESQSGSDIDIVYVCACLLGCYFEKFGIAILGYSSEMKEPKLHKLDVFCASYGIIECFFSGNCILMGG